jgi:hypothetical protein
MDPNATLTKLRDYAVIVLLNDDIESTEAVEIAEAIEALDGWLSKGGFLPSDWDR